MKSVGSTYACDWPDKEINASSHGTVDRLAQRQPQVSGNRKHHPMKVQMIRFILIAKFVHLQQLVSEGSSRVRALGRGLEDSV